MSAREELICELICDTPQTAPRPGYERATLVAVGEGTAWVRLGEGGNLVAASCIVDVCSVDAGREVMIGFECSDPQRPFILGFVRTPTAKPPATRVVVDGERLLLSGHEQVTLQCGDASITLTRSGKVLIKGHYLQSRATGVNSIKGGSVELN